MTNAMVVALAVGGIVGVAGLARVLLPTLALLLVIGLAVYVGAGLAPIGDAVEKIAEFSRVNWRIVLLGIGGSILGQAVHDLVRARTA